MQSRRPLSLLALLFVIVMAIVAFQHRHGVIALARRLVFGEQTAPRAHIFVGQALPTLALASLGGDRSTIAALPGHTLYLTVFTTWCPECVQETPALEKFSRAMVGKPVDIVAVDEEEAPGTVRQFAEKYGLKYPIFIDDQHWTDGILGVHYLPTTFVVDDRGIVRANVPGSLTLRQMQRLVQTGLRHG